MYGFPDTLQNNSFNHMSSESLQRPANNSSEIEICGKIHIKCRGGNSNYNNNEKSSCVSTQTQTFFKQAECYYLNPCHQYKNRQNIECLSFFLSKTEVKKKLKFTGLPTLIANVLEKYVCAHMENSAIRRIQCSEKTW